MPSPAEIVARAVELGQNTVGLADKGYTYGLMEFVQEAQKKGIKPILGMEVYIAARKRTDKESGTDTRRYPLTLLVESQEGYQNLLQLATKSAIEGMYYKPRVDAELLALHGKGLIALSGPIGGTIPQAALAEDKAQVEKLVEEYRGYFGKDNVYFELMDLPNVSGQSEVNAALIRYGKELGVPVVATCNSHYCRTDDVEAHDVLLCIQKNANIADPGRFSMRDTDFSMRTFAEMEAAFSHIPEALENTRVIADRCNVTFNFTDHHIPRFPVEKGDTEEGLITKLSEEGFKKRYPTETKELRDRLEYELSIIKQVGFSGYFLIVADFVNEAKRRGITVGPGRGSAAGSIVSYCLGITGIDPMAHGLLFERFLNPERISMPDIDLDFADTRRDEILEYVRGKYGTDHVVQICTFGTLAARAAVKDVGRAYGIPFLEMNELVKMMSDRPGTKLAEALQQAELKMAYEGNETYRKIIDIAMKLEGKARHVSVHACGVIITEEPAMNYTALQRAPKDEHVIITQYGAKPLESLGLLKMDFLGLMNLTVIQTALLIIERTIGKTLDIETIPLNDKRTFQLLQRGDTTGVFQLESPGMRRYLKQLKPTEFGDITAMVALYRPGPMEWISSFISRKHGKEEVSYVHEVLEPILKPTYGIGIYQEQILQIAQAFAGFSLGEADLLRRAIGKKIKKELDAQREKFISGAVAKGYKKNLAEEIFDDVVTPFAGYGFNKSHAVGYARIAYETAYLKANYPAEFMAALLSADSGDTERVMIEIEECRAMGLPVLPPDINESRSNFTVVPATETDPASIRFGLSAIKGLGESSVRQIIEVREATGPFVSLEDFAKRLPAKVLNKKTIEALAKAGALESFGVDRRLLTEHHEVVSDYAKAAGDAGGAQTDMFGALEDGSDLPKMSFPELPPATAQEKLLWEREVLGLYVSSHPLAGLRKYIGKKAQLIATLTQKEVGKTITVAGIEEGIRKLVTKKGESMAVMMLEDPTGKIEITLFPRVFAEAQKLLGQADSVFVVRGTLDQRGGVMQIRAEAVKRASLATMITNAKAEKFFDEEEAKRGIIVRPQEAEAPEVLEMLDEEGNVVAGEVVKIAEVSTEPDSYFGPLGGWLKKGMQCVDVLVSLGLTEWTVPDAGAPTTAAIEPSPTASAIQPYSIALPERAPKQLLLELKKIFETFPGREKVELKIGAQVIPVSLTVTRSPILEQKVEEALGKYAVV